MGNRLRVLSIDDSKAVHAFLDRCLKDYDYDLTHAFSAKEGIEVLKKDKSFSVVLLDWEMPEMTGPEALVEIKKLGIATPVIMVTTKNDPNEILDLMNKGASEYVMKPFTPDILAEKINSVVGNL